MSRTEAGASGRPQQASPPGVEGPVAGDRPEQHQEHQLGPPGESDDAAAAPPGEGDDAAAALPGGPARRSRAVWEPVVRVAGLVISVLAAVVSGAFELQLTPLRAGDVVSVWRGVAVGSGHGPLLGLSILLAAGLNYAIAWFAVGTTGRRWAIGPAWAVWTLLMMLAAGTRTAEGDHLLAGDDWVALAAILAGSLSFAVFAYRMILRPVPRGRGGSTTASRTATTDRPT
jgi:hypothetical protein